MWFLAQEIRDSTLRGLHHALLVGLVVDDEVLTITFAADLQGFDIAAQHAHAEGVKGRDERLRYRARAYQRFDTRSHLARSLVGKGHRKNRVGLHADRVDQVRNTIGDDARLAAPGPGQDEHRPVHG